jgi:hypothetical protein
MDGWLVSIARRSEDEQHAQKCQKEWVLANKLLALETGVGELSQDAR